MFHIRFDGFCFEWLAFRMFRKIILLLLPWGILFGEQEFRYWTNKEGKTIEAKFIRFAKDRIEIRRKDGLTFKMSPATLSEEDQKLLEELRKRADSRGYLWDDSTAAYELKRQVWLDSERNSPTLYYHKFKIDKVDINKDGEWDGLMLTRKPKDGETQIYAWDVTPDGHLLVKRDSSGGIVLGKYKYDFENGTFVMVEGHGAPFYIPLDK